MNPALRINLSAVGKRFNQEWIFRKVDYILESGTSYAILGSNGSGKSTLLQIISGRMMASEGTVTYETGQSKISDELIFREVAMSAPYLELIEEYTIPELLELHISLKPMLPGIDTKKFMQILGFERLGFKPIRYFSSGMKQRVKLGLAILSDVKLLLLDEPCSNLDRQGMEWYRELIAAYGGERLIVVCSNHQQEEISFCSMQLSVNDYK